uniref:Nucleotidyl transferase n=1 Tax=uncultured organism TaxID=155900 RepID=M1P0V2_9ZZZZ|nr:nucleotidyl transferase [uncultured organism]
MKAVILAAGEGTRLRPFTVSEPKVMISVANKPILEYVVESLVENGIKDIVMVVGYRKESIMSYFGDGDFLGANIEYVTQEKQPSQGGTAHALYQAMGRVPEDFIVLPGDNVISKKTVSEFLENRENESLLITRSDSPSKYGVVTLDDGDLECVVEKPEKSPSHLISTGIYSFTPDVFDYINEAMGERRYDLTSVVQTLKEDRPIKCIITDSTWIDAVYPWDLLDVNATALHDVRKSINGVVEENVTIKGNVMVGEGTIIRAGSYIEGPAIIGEGCDIGPNACILPSTSINDDSSIEPFSVVKNSLIMSGVKVGANSNIENSVIGDGVKLGSKFSNHCDDADIKSNIGHYEVEDIGCMIAEDTVVGSGVTCEAGKIIGADCRIGSGTVIRKNIESGSRVM